MNLHEFNKANRPKILFKCISNCCLIHILVLFIYNFFLHPTVPPRTTHKMIMIVDSKGGKET